MITLNGSDDKTRDEAISLANKINSGALPFALTAENYSTISPSLGANSLQAMVIAGVVAFVLVALFMIANYRLPGAVAVIALLGQTAMTLGIRIRLFLCAQQLHADAAGHRGHHPCHRYGC